MKTIFQVMSRVTTVLAILFCASANADVTVRQFGPVLLILGDDGDDGIQIGQFVSGDIFIRGFDCNQEPTLINGNDEDYVVYSGVQTILVNTRGGNDCVAATNDLILLLRCLDFELPDPRARRFRFDEELAEKIVISGELEIVTGSGNDDVGIGEFETGGAMEVFTDAGFDEVGFCDVCVFTNLLCITGNDADRVLMTSPDFFPEFEFEGNFVKYNATFDTGLGSDDVCIESLFVDVGSLNVITSGGFDSVAIGFCEDGNEPEGFTEDEASVIVGTNLYLNTGLDSDICDVNNTYVGVNFLAFLSGGFDQLYASNCKVHVSTIIDAGWDDDIVDVNNFCTDIDLIIYMGSGSDRCQVGSNVEVGFNFITYLGSGDDDFYVYDTTVGRKVCCFGDAGRDDAFIDDLDASLIQFFMGIDDDLLVMGNCDAGRLFADGGPGYDCFDDLGNGFGTELIISFEDDCDD